MSDYLFLMESRLSPDQWRVLQSVQKASETLGMTLYLSGGAIRDLICGFPIEGLDFVVEGKALQMVRALGHDGGRVVWQSDVLQSAELEFASGVIASVSMARSEDYSKGRTPAVVPAPILTHLRQRDFSINAIGISLNAQSRGLLLDPTNGTGDIERKEIRTLHSRSFVDDPVRLFRAVRFRTRLHFQFEQKTAAQFQAAKENDAAEETSGDSLHQELRRIARERSPAEILKALDKEKLLHAMNPRLQGPRVNFQGITQASKAAQPLLEAGLRPPSFDLFLHLLLSKLPPKDREQIPKRLEMKRDDLAGLHRLESDANRLAKDLMGRDGSSPTRLYHLLTSASADAIVLLQIEFPQAKLQARLKAFLHKYLPLRRELPSKELAELGVATGTPRHQKILDAFFFESIEGKLHGKTDQMKYLRKMAEIGEGKKPAKKAQPLMTPVATAAPAPREKSPVKQKPAAKPMPAAKPKPAKKQVVKAKVKAKPAKKVKAPAKKVKSAPAKHRKK